MSFVHLRTHTEYSVVDGTLRIDEIVKTAAKDGQPALAITDLANLFGAIKFYKEANKRGVKPIIGADIWLEPEGIGAAGEVRPATRLLLLVQNEPGYLNLCEILSRAWVQNVQRNQAWVKWEWLDELNGGLIALSGGLMGCVGQSLAQGDTVRAAELARKLAAIFPRRFYLEVQRAGLPGHDALVLATVPLAAQLQLPVVATHPIQYLAPDDFDAHEARVCVAEGETIANPKRPRRFGRDQHFKTQAEMEALFADVPTALANTLEIARRCSLRLVLGKPQLPNFPTPTLADGSSMPMEDYFRQLSYEGLEERLALLYPKPEKRDAERARYLERLEFELTTILKMGFPGYFLIVSDFIRWAKANGCPVGPGRGSGAGSLVAYVLSITDLDPLHYNLLFERFLNPERVSMPDFDIDFCQGNRDRVIDYVKDRYGRPAVSQIATFGTMAAKAALRDIGRVLGMGYGHVDSIAKLIPAPPGKSVTLARVPEKAEDRDGGVIYARLEAPELEEREKNEEEVAELLSLAMRVEGMVRNIGMHAGGVLIAPGKITDFCPLYQQPGSDSAVSQYDKDDVEAIGLVKFDFLGLATLTILELAKEFIVARHENRKDFAFETIPLDDAAVYKLFSDGLTEAVFQFESGGMQRMLKDAKPSRLEDLIALNALYRPGPMDLIPSFVARKHGKEPVEYPHPMVEWVLSETYGIMVYQEQVMQTAQVLGGYSLGGADMLRRAMGKKKAEEMAEHRAIFRKGAAGNNISQDKADEIFDLMEKFAGYGFNKSHAAAYSLLAYHTAWIKVHHTAEFFAANMTIELDDTDKLRVLRQDALKFGVQFESPDVNVGVYRFEPAPGKAGNKLIRYGLGAIKGTGQGAIEAIIAARNEGGPFRSIFDFCARVDRKSINKRVIEALVKAGAFDKLHPKGLDGRAELLASVGLALEYAGTQAAHADQSGLFDFGGGDDHGSSTREPDYVAAETWDVKQRLSHEKIAIGYFLSGHLFDQVAAEVRQFAKRRIEDLSDSRDPQTLAGIVTDLRIVNGHRGKVAIFKLDDKTAAIEAVVAEELLNANAALLKDDELLILQGKAQPDRFSGGVRFNVIQILDLPTARCRHGRYLRVPATDNLPPVDQVLRDFPARSISTEHGELVQGVPIRLVVERESACGEVDLGEAARFYPSDEALKLWQVGSQGKARLVYSEEQA
ncbi:DNA polymerase III, alpha subunit [Leptothrix cholodnii SP-6]|uniref:DNA polymerase III subunit alpha n=1 Tax=Leptothrix cholodnii (strain ATCC 51168 / LMG 8142 / SP-6) TaxID=395495 RepID=B1Y2N5_LEPCP|nr:DNA polymerase III subunit alpha [Leptothrix cholodnii]ACB33251.1 DNA polymerase III, alpha subunit [Leptothrix cholodnii SP-6]